MGVVISLTFDCISILIRVSENRFSTFFNFFPTFFLSSKNLENSAGRFFILNLVRERLSRPR